MSKTSLRSDYVISPDDAVMQLSLAFHKPVDFVKTCLAVHNVSLPLPRFRTADDGLGPLFSDLSSHYDVTPSRTKQEFTAEVDINNIMARFAASGGDMSTLPLTSKKAMYGDFSTAPASYHAALNYVKDTEQAFMTLDASLRARFENDPQKFLDFVSDPANVKELVQLGLIEQALADQLVPSASAEDLSPAAERASGTLAKAAGGKSGPRPDSSKKAANAVSDGGDEGE